MTWEMRSALKHNDVRDPCLAKIHDEDLGSGYETEMSESWDQLVTPVTYCIKTLWERSAPVEDDQQHEVQFMHLVFTMIDLTVKIVASHIITHINSRILVNTPQNFPHVPNNTWEKQKFKAAYP